MVYILGFLVSLILSKFLCEKKSVNNSIIVYFPSFIKTVLSLLPLILIMAFRWDIGKDTNYLLGHYSVGYSYAALGINKFEYSIGFFAYFWFLASHKVPLFFAYFIISWFYMLSICWLIYKLRLNPQYSIITLFGIDMYISAFAAVRQSFSWGFICLALVLWFENDRKKIQNVLLVGLMIIAVLVHTTALLYILIFALDYLYHKLVKTTKKNYNILMIILLVSTPVIYVVLSYFMRGTGYANNSLYDRDFRDFYFLFLIIVCFECHKYFKRLTYLNKKFIVLMDTVAVLTEIFLLSSLLYVADRIFLLFTPVYLILISEMWQSIKSKSNKYIFTAIMLFLFVMNIRKYYIPGTQTFELYNQYHSVFENWSNIVQMFGR